MRAKARGHTLASPQASLAVDRQTRNTWVLVGVVAALGLAAVAEQMRERMLAPKPLARVNEKSLREIVLECPSCPRRRMERIQGAWTLSEPYSIAADPDMVARLVGVAGAQVRHRYRANQLEPAKVGLAPPFATLALGPLKLAFGTTDAITQARYVGIGEDIALVNDHFSQWLLVPPESLVDPRPFAPLRGLSALSFDGKPIPADRFASATALRATRVESAPSWRSGRRVVASYGGNRQVAFTLGRDGERWLLVRDAPALAYVLDAAQALLLDPGTPAG